MKYSIIISYKEGSEERKNNLKSVLNYLSQLLNDNCEIVLVEQDQISKINWLSEIKNYKYINHIFIENKNIFNKGWGYNVGAKESKFDNLIFHDADMFLKIHIYQDSVNLLKDYDVVKPYKLQYYLNKEDSELFIKNKYDFNFKKHYTGMQAPISGGIFMMKKEKFLLLKGFDEMCYGWGHEDAIFDIKLKKLGLNIYYDINEYIIHIYHKGVNGVFFGNAKNINDNYFSNENKNLYLLHLYEKYSIIELEEKINTIEYYGDKNKNMIEIDYISKKIPKIIHQIWFGDQSKRPKEIMDKWKTMNPSWEYWLWTEEDIKRVFGKLQNQKHFDNLINLKKHLDIILPNENITDDLYLVGQADLARYEILYTFGGIYIDADSDPIRPLNDDFCNNEFFCAYENEEIKKGMINNAVLGCSKFNSFMDLLIQNLKKIPFILYDKPWITTSPVFLTNTIKSNPDFNIMIYPSYYFYPNHHEGKNYDGDDTNNIYCNHLWGNTFKELKKKNIYDNNYKDIISEIPKRIFFYLDNNYLSWMKYMTLYSCKKFNPDWEIILYLFNNKQEKEWFDLLNNYLINNNRGLGWFDELSKSDNLDENNYINKLNELDIKIEKFEWPEEINNQIIDILPIYKSELFKYYQLYQNGGIYCDLDIIFFKSLDSFYKEINNNYDTIIYNYGDILTNLIGSSKNNIFFKELFDFSIKNLNMDNYRLSGMNFINKKFNIDCSNSNILNKIESLYPELKIYNISNSLINYFDISNIQNNYTYPVNTYDFDEKSIGYNWFSNHKISQYYDNMLTESNYMYHNTTFSNIVNNINDLKLLKNNKFIIVVTVYNAEKYIKKCIDSILDQDYDNFNFVVIDDCSTDNTYKILKDLNNEYIFDLIRNNKRNMSPLSNIIKGIETLSKDKEDIIIPIDGDDWLNSNDVLSYLNKIYQDEIYMTYGNFEMLSYQIDKKPLYEGWICSTCKHVPDTRTYRKSGLWLVHHLRTFKRKLWDLIDDKDLRNENGEYYQIASDNAWIFPLVEMCGHKYMRFIEKILYVHNDSNPINEFKVDWDEVMKISTYIRNKKEYDEINKI